MSLNDKRILLIIGGGIAAYKSLDLIRRLKERGAKVRAILTEGGAQFVTPLSVAAISRRALLHRTLFASTDESDMGHIRLSRDADLVVVAPATADLMAKMAHGIANDLATTALLATDKRVLIAPAMNVRMWNNPATQRNFAQLTADGIVSVGPNEGEMACGESPVSAAWPSRWRSSPRSKACLNEMPASDALKGKADAGHLRADAGADRSRALHRQSLFRQAGPCHRRAAAAAGAEVTLVSGPVEIPDRRA